MQDAIILYENGKAIGGEGHPTNADEITFDNSNTDLVSENVEDAIVEVNAKTSGLTRMTKLWENNSLTSNFAAQTVTLSSSDYDFLYTECVYGTSGLTYGATGMISKDMSSDVSRYGSNGSVYGFHRRAFTVQANDKTKCDISADMFYPANGGNTIDYSQYLVPKIIYGVKII